ncbi:MAG: hypothetical protein SGJ09_00775 [Phycisphaerae bacterium]|nr:hypothetical protein [Phycisphaerae bacterium]
MTMFCLAAILIQAPGTQEPVKATSVAPFPAQSGDASTDWRVAEQGALTSHVQLTFPEQFAKAGEAYFSPNDSRIVFQAVEKPADGATPEEYYAMYIADVVRKDGKIVGLSGITRLSPKGSANTCGWFDPTDANTIYFASTVGPPTASEPPGYQRGTGRYRWMFPPEMRIVMADLKTADGSAASLIPVVGDGKAYVAEGSISPDGKYLLYCDLAQNQGDIVVLNRQNDDKLVLVSAPGYDGGPFFSPDGKRIVYRSDRNGDNMLQVFVADLVFDAQGHITGIAEEHQVTRDGNVNWCPYFHPSGKFLVFASSAVSHRNYEIFAVDATSLLRDGVRQSRYGTNLRRVTQADGADVLPVFTHDGKWMMWTGQRSDDKSSQLFVAEWGLPNDPPKPPEQTRTGRPASGSDTKR